jgi:hypothetical protein
MLVGVVAVGADAIAGAYGPLSAATPARRSGLRACRGQEGRRAVEGGDQHTPARAMADAGHNSTPDARLVTTCLTHVCTQPWQRNVGTPSSGQPATCARGISSDELKGVRELAVLDLEPLDPHLGLGPQVRAGAPGDGEADLGAIASGAGEARLTRADAFPCGARATVSRSSRSRPDSPPPHHSRSSLPTTRRRHAQRPGLDRDH